MKYKFLHYIIKLFFILTKYHRDSLILLNNDSISKEDIDNTQINLAQLLDEENLDQDLLVNSRLIGNLSQNFHINSSIKIKEILLPEFLKYISRYFGSSKIKCVSNIFS